MSDEYGRTDFGGTIYPETLRGFTRSLLRPRPLPFILPSNSVRPELFTAVRPSVRPKRRRAEMQNEVWPHGGRTPPPRSMQSSVTRRPIRIKVTGDFGTEFAFGYGSRAR
jgi:hypothetical protein